jgi:hypothetical protein
VAYCKCRGITRRATPHAGATEVIRGIRITDRGMAKELYEFRNVP